MKSRLSLSLPLLFVLSAAISSAAQCALSSTNPSVTICSPSNGSTVTSPVNIVAGTTDSSSVTTMAIYVDNTLAWKGNGSQENQSVTMSAGSHYVVVQAWDSAGRVFKTPENITVTTSSSGGGGGGGGGGTPGVCAGGDPSITICSPANGSTVTSPVNIVASTNDSAGVTTIAVYVDNQLADKENVSQLSTSVPMSQGSHYVVVQSWDNSGRVLKTSENINVSSTGGGTAAPTISFTANPTSITSGSTATLGWATTNATSVSIDNGLGPQATSGTVTVQPTTTTTYTLTATGPGGTATSTATLTVTPPSGGGGSGGGGGGSGTCSPTGGVPSVTICSPANGSTVSSPVTLLAAGSSSASIVAFAVYVDNSLAWKGDTSSVNQSITMSNGSHYVVVQFWDSNGSVTKGSENITVGPTVTNPPPTVTSFTATPTTITSGQSTTLTWQTSNATGVTISGVGTFGASGSTTVSPTTTTTYTLTASGSGGTTATSAVTVTVTSPTTPVVNSFTATPTTISAGQTATLNWTTTNATGVTISGLGSFSASGIATVSPAATTTYTLTATGAGGATSTANLTVTVNAASAPSITSFTATPASIASGQSATLSWATANVTGVSIDNGVGAGGPSGTATVKPAATTTYTLTASGTNGSTVTSKATVTVAPVVTTCTPTGAAPSITICSPSNGSTVASPVHMLAAPASNNGVAAIAIYVDNTLAWKQNVQTVDTTLTMSTGTHYVVFQFWDNSGSVTKASENITINPNATSVTIAMSASPSLINSGGSATLTWTSTNATSVTIDNGVGVVAPSGGTVVKPTATTTYTATATGSTGTASTSATVSVSGSGGGSGPGLTSINHIIFTLQENRSFDSYLGMLNTYRASLGLPQDVDGLTLDSSGNPTNSNAGYNNGSPGPQIRSFHMNTVCTDNMSPAWDESHVDANLSNPSSNTFLNNGFAFVAGKFAHDTGLWDTTGQRAMGYYDWTQIPYYYFMASQFATSDRWFSPAPTNTDPSRHYMYAATSDGRAYPATAQENVPTIWNLLQNAGVTWRVYVANGSDTLMNAYTTLSALQDHIAPMSQFFTDLQNGTLPQVVTLETDALNEHPENNIQQGVAFIASAMNAFMSSSAYKDGVFILSYDEDGGLYDHVAPQMTVSPDGIKPLDLASTDVPGDFTRTGFRLPMIVVSPFTKPHFVSHTARDNTAILKLIEGRFGLPSLTARDSAQADMSEFFDFVNVPWSTPPQPPAQPTNAPCYFDHLP